MAIWWRQDSIAALKAQKSLAELQAENDSLKKKLDTLDKKYKKQLDELNDEVNTAMLAMCDIYESMGGEG